MSKKKTPQELFHKEIDEIYKKAMAEWAVLFGVERSRAHWSTGFFFVSVGQPRYPMR